MQAKTKEEKKAFFLRKGKKVLVISAHPDDAEWCAGGTLTKLIKSGAEVHVGIMTDGGKGSSNPRTNPKKVAATRKKEHLSAAKYMGIKKSYFLDFEDGTLDSPLALRKEITRLIRIVKPDIVFSFDPMTKLLNHPDHRVTGQAALDAVYPAARDIFHYPELAKKGLKPHKVAEVFLFYTDTPNVFVDIANEIDKKVEAISKHVSQMPEYKELKNIIYIEAKKTAKGQRAEYAEAFRYMVMPK